MAMYLLQNTHKKQQQKHAIFKTKGNNSKKKHTLKNTKDHYL
jgi:hypothetical protein